MTAPSPDLTDRLVSAVVSRDAATVRSCLEQGAAPDTLGPDGLPLLCTAAAGFDHLTAEILVEGGADPDRELADGSTPLLRAVDTGSPALVAAVLGDAPRLRVPEASRRQLLGLARHWYEIGVVEELRRRTGAAGAAVTLRMDDTHDDGAIDEISLGGLTARAGHGAVLTYLEWRFGLLPPLSEVMARAVPHAEDGDSNWYFASYCLGRRRGPRIWSELTALRRHPDPKHRRFLASVLWHRGTSVPVDRASDVVGDADFLASWARDEPDGHVLADVLGAYNNSDHPGQEAIGLRHADHPDPRVRREAAFCLSRERTARSAAAESALLDMVRDPDPDVRATVAQVFAPRFAPDNPLAPAIRDALLLLLADDALRVRRNAAESLALSDDRTTPVLNAFLALLDDDNEDLRLEAAFALARRGDPRAEQAYERVGPVDAFSEHDHRLFALWRYGVGGQPDRA
ncbi:HEAT repeat-containing protein [Streptomyces sp. TLI_053]|uniref:HEAT repeat domain-containing protein n=1 Tax=Streptomyces sp. TLI_053 TaxID=1855352 RepID=UPI00087B6BF6|nr:HEAT repeat domain-containing protein [Streptomyces sp. TLI_053]SDT83231.1 HEAT repeat-containing protein [Streptomyces sp. TLI_053]